MDLNTVMNWIARWEEGPQGPALTAYKDSMGHPTIGIGFNLDRSDAEAKITALGLNYQAVCSGQASLTLDQVNQLFAGDVKAAAAGAASIVPGFDSLPSDAQMVIVDMVFNLGMHGFSQFGRTIQALENKNWAMAAVEMTASAWYTQTGQRSKGDVDVIRRLALSATLSSSSPAPGGDDGTSNG